MTSWDDGVLETRKSERIAELLGDPELIADLSWGLVDTAVLHVRAAFGDVIVKTAGVGNTHIARETNAFRNYVRPLAVAGRASRLVHSDDDLNLIVLEYQPGVLVQGSGSDLSLDVHRQAGETLRILHDAAASGVDEDYVARVSAKAVLWLDGAHRIHPSAERAARQILDRIPRRSVVTVPTHGDWHTRNWLIDDGFVKVIDFGRFAIRPAGTDLCRLAVKEWRSEPSLEGAFLAGYGDDPRDPELWRVDLLCEAIGTAAWAYQVEDYAFEHQGQRQLTDALALF